MSELGRLGYKLITGSKLSKIILTLPILLLYCLIFFPSLDIMNFSTSTRVKISNVDNILYTAEIESFSSSAIWVTSFEFSFIENNTARVQTLLSD